jgi:hypothetical protein
MKRAMHVSLIMLITSSGAIMGAVIAPPTVPSWLAEITTYHIVAVCLFFSAMAGGIAWLVSAHKSPDEYGFGTEGLKETIDSNHKCLLKVTEEQGETQRKTLNRTNQMLYIQIHNARTRATDHGTSFPEWADDLLKSGALLDE